MNRTILILPIVFLLSAWTPTEANARILSIDIPKKGAQVLVGALNVTGTSTTNTTQTCNVQIKINKAVYQNVTALGSGKANYSKWIAVIQNGQCPRQQQQAPPDQSQQGENNTG
jgi:hypothetical protein